MPVTVLGWLDAALVRTLGTATALATLALLVSLPGSPHRMARPVGNGQRSSCPARSHRPWTLVMFSHPPPPPHSPSIPFCSGRTPGPGWLRATVNP